MYIITGNVLKEIVEPAGGIINIRQVQSGDHTLSVLELWGAEYQENDALLIEQQHQLLFTTICQRERCPVQYVGQVTESGTVVVHDSNDNTTPVNLDLHAVLGNIPQKTYELHRIQPVLQPIVIPDNLSVPGILDRLFRLLHVGSKRFLSSKVDRSVTGLIAQQSCVGPLHTPLSDVAVVASSLYDLHGIASAVGEQPIKGLISYQSMARLTVGEALTNIMFALCTSRQHIKCSGNWMWAAKLPGEGAALYDTCKSMHDIMIATGISVDGGKDSLSMAARTDTNELVKAPGTLVITLYCSCPDITKTITPDLKSRGNSTLVYINMSEKYKQWDISSLGGTSYAQVYNQVGSSTSDLHDVQYFNLVWDTVQQLLLQRLLLSGHDISDGGLLTAVCEMSFAGNAGINVSFNDSKLTYHTQHALLFGEDLGCVLEIHNDKLTQVQSIFQQMDINAVIIGTTTSEYNINVQINDKYVLQSTVAELRDLWESTSFELEKLQTNPQCAIDEQNLLKSRTDPQYKLTYTPQPTSTDILSGSHKPRVAVIREEGSNGDREMIGALYSAGFDVWDVHMNDLLNGTINISESPWRGIVFVGGFSYADVLDSAKGWAAVIKYNTILSTQFNEFYERTDTFSLGVCNGCQLMALLGWVGAVDSQSVCNSDNPPARFIHNRSGRYESRWVTLKIEDTNGILFKDMSGSVLGCWTAHGEGRAYFPYSDDYVNQIESNNLVPMRYVDDHGNTTEQYPLNPNGSVHGIAGLISTDGRHCAIMPHPERCQKLWSWPWQPQSEEWQNSVAGECPWMKLFQNAYTWCIQNTTQNNHSTSIPPTINTNTTQSTDTITATSSTIHTSSTDKLQQQNELITRQLSSTLKQTNLSSPLENRFIGKVRDIYTLYDNLMILITTDRISAFDRSLTEIPYKGAVLNQVAEYWFKHTKHIVQNHYIASPHPNVTIALKCKPFAVEIVVRGYITGTTSTSLWTHYSKGVRNYCGNELPDGLVKNQKLSHNIVTPTTKSDEHDVPISGTDIVKHNLMTQSQWNTIHDIALKLFDYGQQLSLQHGLLLVDTKYEFGIDSSNNIILIDEIHTPDSSRYWIADTYQQCIDTQQEPDNIDKEFVRLWYSKNCDPYNDEILPTPPQSLIVELSRRYIQLYEMITGNTFNMSTSHTSVEQEVQQSIQQWIEQYNGNDRQLSSSITTSSPQQPSEPNLLLSPRTQLMENILGDMQL